MATTTPAPDAWADSLHLLRLSGTLYCRAELTAPWGVAIPDLPTSMGLVVVSRGSCVLEVAGEPAHVLAQGSAALVPHGRPHRLLSAPGASVTSLFDLPVEQVSDVYERVRFGGGGEATHATYAVLQVREVAARRLVAQLPAVLLVEPWGGTHDTVHEVLRLVARELAELRPGGETVLTRLADVLVVAVLRAWLEDDEAARRGWLAALRDEHLGRVLALLHRDPGREWDVATMAAEARMSRSAFVERFTQVVGEPPARYLTAWRLQVAHARLADGRDTVSDVARASGYGSDAAFGRAFKQAYGVPPGQVRRAAGVA